MVPMRMSLPPKMYSLGKERYRVRKSFDRVIYLLAIVDKGGVVGAAMGLCALRTKLIPVTFLHVVAVGLHGSQIERLGHVERFLLLDSGRAAEAIRAEAGAAVSAVLHHRVQP